MNKPFYFSLVFTLGILLIASVSKAQQVHVEMQVEQSVEHQNDVKEAIIGIVGNDESKIAKALRKIETLKQQGFKVITRQKFDRYVHRIEDKMGQTSNLDTRKEMALELERFKASVLILEEHIH